MSSSEEQTKEPCKTMTESQKLPITQKQDTFNETVEETLAEHQNKDIQEAEEMAYEELKPNYLS